MLCHCKALNCFLKPRKQCNFQTDFSTCCFPLTLEQTRNMMRQSQYCQTNNSKISCPLHALKNGDLINIITL